MAKHLAEMLKDIWEQKGMPSSINREVTLGFANKIWEGLKEGYGKDVGNINYNSPDFEMITHLQTNVYAFSAAKNWQQMKAITQSIVGEDGKIRTFAQFKDAAGLINTKHEGWLRTEYNTAIASGQMASKWVDIQANKDVLPMLEYDAVMDGRTSDICADFNGIIKEVDDSFWDAFYPPNHFGCRSTVRQLSSGRPTDTSKIAVPEGIPEMFKVNLAKERLVFPPTHPYFIGLPASILKQAEALIIDGNYERRIEGKHGGYVDVHAKTDNNKKMQHIAASEILANKGTQIKLTPEIHINDTANRKLFYPELAANNASNPDGRFDGILGDYKIPDNAYVTHDNIKKAISGTARKEVDICVISLLDNNYNKYEVLSGIRGALNKKGTNKSIKQVWIIFKDKSVLKIPRGIITNKDFFKIVNTY